MLVRRCDWQEIVGPTVKCCTATEGVKACILLEERIGTLDLCSSHFRSIEAMLTCLVKLDKIEGRK